jgi:lipopolysaccharide transport system ATP-binding protein
MQPIIRVENLGKCYRIHHKTQERYTALRDVIARKAGRAFAKLKFGKTEKLNSLPDSQPFSVSASSEDFWALKDINFEIQPGEVVGIIGRNGAGKSTLLKILSRITEPTKGRITLNGRVASLLEVGTGFHPELTGRENIFLNGAILGMSRKEIQSKFDEIVDFAGVEKFLDTPVKRYSSGMYVRLAFAVAAHLEPEILIIDEVLAVGDAEFQKKCLGKMGEVAKGGRTVLFVSHNMAAIQSLCQRGILIDQGQVTFSGSPDEAIQLYMDRMAAHTGDHLWLPSANTTLAPVTFQRIEMELTGSQPHHQLRFDIELQCQGSGPPMMFAIDMKTALGFPLLQIMPHAEPFLERRDGTMQFTLEVDLPPLVPGDYFLDFWLGQQHTETLDFITDILRLSIHESPNVGRTHPHLPEHGHLTPVSRVSIVKRPRIQMEDSPVITTNNS